MSDLLTDKDLHVLDGPDFSDIPLNTPNDEIVAHVEHSIRLGYPQVKPQPVQRETVCIVGGGPTLEDTFEELRDLYFGGALIVTVNGSYQWCLDRNIQPSAQIVLDARAENARFVDPPAPRCKYFIASQCHPETWKRVEGRSDVYIWHGAMTYNEHLRPILDRYYGGHWTPMPGGTTVVIRAIQLLRVLGFMRFHLFGVDSCVKRGLHHAYPQPENDGDVIQPVRISRNGEQGRYFECAAFHQKQLECFLQMIRLYGHLFLLHVHGDGMLAYALKLGADAVQMEVKP